MELKELDRLLDDVASGAVSPEDAAIKLRTAPFSDLGYAKVDHHRGLRQGVAEVIFGEGKTPDQIAGIVSSMLDANQKRILITRLKARAAKEVEQHLASPSLFTYYDVANMATIGDAPKPDGVGTIVVACGGTSDLFVAEEAAITAEMLGNQVVRLFDVGVAGLHRLLAHTQELVRASVVIAVAGMEGALPSVVGGLVSCPVIAVPTSVGYGAAFDGLAALLAMLNSCASGVSVVNIDNGFGAGYQASLINHVR